VNGSVEAHTEFGKGIDLCREGGCQRLDIGAGAGDGKLNLSVLVCTGNDLGDETTYACLDGGSYLIHQHDSSVRYGGQGVTGVR
jgi:hypothetical protein